MNMDYSVPVLDLDAYLRGLPGEAQRLAPEVKRALENIGFLVITGHRIPPDLLARVHEVSKAFFDLPEAESELVAGYQVEYSSTLFLMYMIGELANIVLMCAMLTLLFFGGWHSPIPWAPLESIPVFWFMLKTFFFFFMFAMVKAFVPRYRYDQLMRLGWRKLLPASLVNVVVTAVVILAIQGGGEQFQRGITVAGQLTMATLATLGLAGFIGLVLFLLAPVKKRRLVVSSAQRYASELGGTFEAKMEA